VEFGKSLIQFNFGQETSSPESKCFAIKLQYVLPQERGHVHSPQGQRYVYLVLREGATNYMHMNQEAPPSSGAGIYWF
jgi:hypothetical protein